MITIYQLYSLTGYHPHSRTKWTKKHFHITTKESKQVIYESYDEAAQYLQVVSKKPNYKGLLHYFPNTSIHNETHQEQTNRIIGKNQLIDRMNKDKEEEFKTFIRNCSNCLYNGEDNLCNCDLECIDFNRHIPMMKVKNLLPMITKDDYAVLKNCFDDLLEMYQGLEQRLLIVEKRTELPKRAFRIEVINAVSEICRKNNRKQKEVYKEVYQGFDVRHGITNETKNKELKISYLEWYDKHDYLPKLLNYIKEIYKI